MHWYQPKEYSLSIVFGGSGTLAALKFFGEFPTKSHFDQ
jgi:hypothetical protein